MEKVGHVRWPCRVAPAFEENVLEQLGRSPITGALCNFVTNIEAVSVLANRCMGC